MTHSAMRDLLLTNRLLGVAFLGVTSVPTRNYPLVDDPNLHARVDIDSVAASASSATFSCTDDALILKVNCRSFAGRDCIAALTL